MRPELEQITDFLAIDALKISSFWFGLQATGLEPEAKVNIRLKDGTDIALTVNRKKLSELLKFFAERLVPVRMDEEWIKAMHK